MRLNFPFMGRNAEREYSFSRVMLKLEERDENNIMLNGEDIYAIDIQ